MNNKSLKTLLIFNGLFVLAANMLGPLYAVFVGTIAKGIFPITLSWSVFLVSTIVFSIFIGKIGDKIKEK
jgi:uncharacterized membrane protein